MHDHRIEPPFPDGSATLVVGMGCCWGAERLFRQADGVCSTAFQASDEQRVVVDSSRDAHRATLTAAGRGTVTTEIAPLREFYYPEDYHQQYPTEVPNGYRGLGGTGVRCPVGPGVRPDSVCPESGCVARWLRGPVVAWPGGCVARWLRGPVVAWPGGCVARWSGTVAGRCAAGRG